MFPNCWLFPVLPITYNESKDTRKKTDGLAALVPATAPLELECVTTKSGVPLEIVRSITTSQVKAPGVFFHVHGGGYQAGRAFAYRGFASELSKRLGGIEVVLVDYRLAPEADLLTETIVDCLDAYKHVVEKYGVDQLAIGGDSAGGGMISNLLHMIATENLPFPKAAVLLSPYIDLTFSYDTIEAHADVDAMILPDDAKNTAKICFAGKDYGPMDLPCMGPVNRAQEWPSILVMTGSHEVLTGDSRNFVKKLEKHGVDVTYVEQVGMPHVYPIFYTWMEEADHALSHMTQWTRSRIGF